MPLPLTIKSDNIVLFWQYVMSLASVDYFPSHLQRRVFICDKLNFSSASSMHFPRDCF